MNCIYEQRTLQKIHDTKSVIQGSINISNSEIERLQAEANKRGVWCIPLLHKYSRAGVQGRWGEDYASVVRADKTEFVATNDKTQDSTNVVSK